MLKSVTITLLLLTFINGTSWAQIYATPSHGVTTNDGVKQTHKQQSQLRSSTKKAVPVEKNPPNKVPAVTKPQAIKLPVVTAISTSSSKQNSVGFQSLAQMNELIEIGMPALALSLLEDEQAKLRAFSPDWYAFEYKRIYLYTALDRWQAQSDRVQWLLDNATGKFDITEKLHHWFATQQVMAQLQKKQSELALKNLTQLLWRKKNDPIEANLIALWRRLVVRAYLQLGRDEDARIALVLYDNDYKSNQQDVDWLILQARVLLKTQRPALALKSLKKVSTEDAKALSFIARLRSQPAQVKQIKQDLYQSLAGKVLTVSARWAYAYVAYEIAIIENDFIAQVDSLETMLILNPKYPVLGDAFQITSDNWWASYKKFGLKLANQYNLVMGLNSQWNMKLTNLVEKSPKQALALHVALALQTENKNTRKAEHKKIIGLIQKNKKQGNKLITQLYLQSETIKNVAVLPQATRYLLVDKALAKGQYVQASRLMAGLKQPPAGKSLFNWRMRKARVLLLKGDYQQSEKVIQQTFSKKPKITKSELDRYMQVVFDFQTTQNHQQALNLFNLISFKDLDEKLQREIYFWKAESYFSLKKYDYAALSYLKSAHAIKGEENDLWAQSARFKAGSALMSAKIYDDAEQVYQRLLVVTSSETRKGIIKQNLQKIHLLRNALANKNKSKNKISKRESDKGTNNTPPKSKKSNDKQKIIKQKVNK